MARPREVARRGATLLKEAGQENLTFELLNRNVDQPYKFNGLWVIDEWSKIGVHVTQRVLQTGPFGEALRNGDFDTVVDGDCQNIVNPLLDGTKYLPHTVSPSNYGNYEDPALIEIYDRMVRETDFAKQRDFILGDAGFDGDKGLPVGVRPWDHQLRQAVLLAAPYQVVASAPVEGFLHRVNDLDTLGDDEPETPCHLNK